PQGIGKISSVQVLAGYHVILDGVGGTDAEPALRAVGWEGRGGARGFSGGGGRYVSIGFAAGVPRITLGPALFKNASIMGIQPSSDEHRLPARNPRALQVLFDWYRDGKLRPLVTQVLPLEEAAGALELMKERRATGRIVLKPRHDE